jgi:uncharacterized membrane protein
MRGREIDQKTRDGAETERARERERVHEEKHIEREQILFVLLFIYSPQICPLSVKGEETNADFHEGSSA